MSVKKFVTKELSRIDDEHFSESLKTPLRKDAFKIPDIEKLNRLKKVRDILDILGMDLKEYSLAGTLKRVAKILRNEIFSGLNPLIPTLQHLKTVINMAKCLLKKILLLILHANTTFYQ